MSEQKKITALPTCAILFARAPEAGKVKTRLQSHLSPQQAATLYTAFLQDSVRLLVDSDVDRPVIAASEEAGVPVLRHLLDPAADLDLTFITQRGLDLGQRMQAALRAAFDAGAGRAVLVGTDSPSLPADTIRQALRRLERADVVLGPVVDGGYYLVGLRADRSAEAEEALFSGIEWSTSSVLAQSVARLPDSASVELLPMWYDVDEVHEAQTLRSHLRALERAGQRVAPHSRLALEGLDLG